MGPVIRRKAARELATAGSPDVVPLLVAALSDDDAGVRGMADAGLRGLKDAAAIDALCGIWAEGRAEPLATMLCAQRFVARAPVKVRVLSALLVGVPLDDAEAVPHLVAALTDRDAQVRAAADAALRGLKDPGAIDALCGIWAETRAEALGAILRTQRFLARAPVQVRVLSALLVGTPADDAEALPHLVAALADRDAQLRSSADSALRALTHRDGVDILCALVLDQPDGRAATICIETGKRPSDPEQACLFLFVTRQLDHYFQEDHDFELLRPAYERASPETKARVMEIVRSGDRRCLGFFGRRKPLTDCTDQEITLAIESGVRHREWPRLFRAVLDLPLKHGLALLGTLRESGWVPEQAAMRALYRALLAEAEGDGSAPASQAQRPDHSSSVFERWLVEGRTGPLAGLSEPDLLARLANATPPDGVTIVGALASKASPGSEASRVVAASEHWLVRLAGYVTGLCRTDLGRNDVADDNHWVRELIGATSVVDFWPARALPADLDQLNAAPSEAFVGKLGVARRLLRILLAHRVTAPEMTECVFEAGEFAGEFEEA